jgi:3-hydroxy-9,10-secoandrosta-1,3,5(10)-triene-9,17-dione monooxygenase reductase component
MPATGQTALAPASAEMVDGGRAAPPPPFDAGTFRRTLGRFATGVTLVTAAGPSEPLGLIVNAFTSVSLEPPLIAICPSRESFTWSRMRHGERFGINVLGVQHADYVRHAAQAHADRFVGIDHVATPSGVPRIPSAAAFLECEPVAQHLAGDHWIVIARVHEVFADFSEQPVVFRDGTLGSFASLELTNHDRRPRHRSEENQP